MMTPSGRHPRIAVAPTLALSLLALTPIAELRRADQNPDARLRLMQGLDDFLEHPRDRKLFGLTPKPDSNPKTASEGSSRVG